MHVVVEVVREGQVKIVVGVEEGHFAAHARPLLESFGGADDGTQAGCVKPVLSGS